MATTELEPQHMMKGWDNEQKLLGDAVYGARRDGEAIRVLEAGCGKRWVLTPNRDEVHITGVDADAEALRIRRDVRGDLDDEILGDLRTVELPAASFDVVYCSYVLEHVAGAEGVLDRFDTSLRPGGRLIIRVPDGDSVYGFVTKHSPHGLHVLYKRYIERNKNAGKPGHAPYPTVYDQVVTLRGLRDWAARNGFTVLEEYGTNSYLRYFGPFRRVVDLALHGVAAASHGRLSAGHNNICLIMEKNAVPAADQNEDVPPA